VTELTSKQMRRRTVPVLIGIGLATAAAHMGNNFVTYLVGGLIDRFGFTPSAVGAWSMVETLAYGFAMLTIALRESALSPRLLATVAAVLIVPAQAAAAGLQFVSERDSAYAALVATRIATGAGFGLMNSAVNLSATAVGRPERAIAFGIVIQTTLFSLLNLGLPKIGEAYGSAGMFAALSAASLILTPAILLLPKTGSSAAPTSRRASAVGVAGPPALDVFCVLATAALISCGLTGVFTFAERLARSLGVSAVLFGRFQSAATLASAAGAAVLAVVAARLTRARPTTLGLIVCSGACTLLASAQSNVVFATALIVFNVAWLWTYALVLGVAYAVDGTGRLAVLTSATCFIAASVGALVTGVAVQALRTYSAAGWVGAVCCGVAIPLLLTLTLRLDRGA